ncbi:ankyrin repeat domain-containing protein 7 isoform X2 [Oryctolagus cuniculus]|uniref:ankyrin repeat domain-containing protein 7 isoform X2 n=1 Tax=Oryctolagus cuniculus TaxID=9986 RepID=UPI0038799E48
MQSYQEAEVEILRERSSICCFTLQMATTARAASIQSQESGASPGFQCRCGEKPLGASRMRKIVWWASKKSSVGCENGIEAQFGYCIQRKELRKLHKAASEGDVARVQHLCLLKKSSVNDRDRNNRTALHLACASGHSEVVMLLLERKCMINVTDNDNMTPLMKAVQSHEEKCARILLDHGADPNIIDENGNTALHYAAYCENVGIAKQLLLRSADIEVRNKDGFTPLLLAIYENGEEIAEFLINKGANIHAVDKIKRTALMLAAQYRSTRIVRLLLEKGIDASCLNMYGWPAEKFALVTFNLANRQLILDYEDEHRYKMLEKNNPDPDFSFLTWQTIGRPVMAQVTELLSLMSKPGLHSWLLVSALAHLQLLWTFQE